MRKFNLFNFLEKKMGVADISPITQTLLDQVAFKELALQIAVSYIANTMSKCEFKVFENGEEVKNKLYYKLNVDPNPNQNSSQFINKFVEQYYYDGAALVVPHGEHIYCADSYDVDESNPLKEFEYYNVTFGTYQIKWKHKANEVFVMQLDNKRVKGLIDSLYTQYGEIIAQALSAYKRTNGVKYKLLLEQYQAGDQRFQQIYKESLKDQLKEFLEKDNGLFPQYRGMDLQEFSKGNPKDTKDIVEMRKEIFEVVAQAFKIPLSMMYGNITNMNEIVKVYLSFCIDPLADMIGEEISRKYYGFYGWKSGNYVKVDTSCINHVDILEVADKVDKAISSGVVNIDDLRKRLDMHELGTAFSTAHWITKNYALAEDMMNSDLIEGGE